MLYTPDDYYKEPDMEQPLASPEVPDFGQSRYEYRRAVRSRCSRIGFALCILWLSMQITSLLSGYLGLLGTSLLAYAVGVPLMLLVLRPFPEIMAEPKKMRISKLIMFLVLAAGMGYALNLVGQLINILIRYVSPDGTGGFNPIDEILQQIDGGLMLYMALCAPVLEELVFRKLLLNRMRPLGEKAAILFTAIMFGLMHGNLNQFLYATAIGIILGYMAVKTGRIVYSIVVHMCINSFSVILSLIMLQTGEVWESVIPLVLPAIGVFVIFIMIAAFINLLIYRKKTKLKPGDWPQGIGYRDFSSAMYINPGVLLFIAISLILISLFALFI